LVTLLLKNLSHTGGQGRAMTLGKANDCISERKEISNSAVAFVVGEKVYFREKLEK